MAASEANIFPLDLSLPAAVRPRVAVVAAWQGHGGELRAWLEQVAALEGAAELEVVVVASPTLSAELAPRESLPGLRHLEASADAPLAALRRSGMAAARGDIVVLTDHREPEFATRLAGILQAISVVS